jgi:hypothetical protein
MISVNGNNRQDKTGSGQSTVLTQAILCQMLQQGLLPDVQLIHGIDFSKGILFEDVSSAAMPSEDTTHLPTAHLPKGLLREPQNGDPQGGDPQGEDLQRVWDSLPEYELTPHRRLNADRLLRAFYDWVLQFHADAENRALYLKRIQAKAFPAAWERWTDSEPWLCVKEEAWVSMDAVQQFLESSLELFHHERINAFLKVVYPAACLDDEFIDVDNPLVKAALDEFTATELARRPEWEINAALDEIRARGTQETQEAVTA